jgi:hypothetical protein
MSGRPAGNIDGFGLDERRHRGGVADGNDGIKAWAAAKPGAGRRAKRSLSRRLLIVAVATVLVVTLTVWGAALTRHISSSSVAARLTAKSAARAGTTAPDAGARSELPAGTFFALPSTTVPSTTVPNTTVPIAVGATGAGSPQVSGVARPCPLPGYKGPFPPPSRRMLAVALSCRQARSLRRPVRHRPKPPVRHRPKPPVRHRPKPRPASRPPADLAPPRPAALRPAAGCQGTFLAGS